MQERDMRTKYRVASETEDNNSQLDRYNLAGDSNLLVKYPRKFRHCQINQNVCRSCEFRASPEVYLKQGERKTNSTLFQDKRRTASGQEYVFSCINERFGSQECEKR